MVHVPAVVSAAAVMALALLASPVIRADDPRPRAALEGHTGTVSVLAFRPDGKVLASAGSDGSVRLWDPATGKPIAVLTPDALAHEVRALAFSPDGKTLATGGSEDVVRLWDPATGKQAATLKGVGNSLAFSPDGKTLAVGGWGICVALWDLGTLKRRDTEFEGGGVADRALAYRPDGKVLASGYSNGTIVLRDGPTGARREVLPGGRSDHNPLTFSADGDLAYVMAQAGELGPPTEKGRRAGRARTIRVRYGNPDRGTAELTGHAGPVRALAFRPDGKALASAGEDVAVEWDLATGKGRVVYDGKGRAVHAVAYSPDGKTLAAAGADGGVRIWDVAAIARPAK